jgi:hypothetical protein
MKSFLSLIEVFVKPEFLPKIELHLSLEKTLYRSF